MNLTAASLLLGSQINMVAMENGTFALEELEGEDDDP